MSDQQGQRQTRYDATPRLGPADILSADALKYVNQVPRLQAAAAADPTYNGSDAEKRYLADD